jgi:hypothetical protein
MKTRTRAALTALALSSAMGCTTRYVAFTTATKFALDISQKADQTVDVSMGYDRAELASIPAMTNQNAGKDHDTYAVLGMFSVSYGDLTKPLVLNQVFATGVAARNAAASLKGRKYFHSKAMTVLEQKKEQARAGGLLPEGSK